MTDLRALLAPIRARLAAADSEPSRWLTGNDGNPVYYQSLGSRADLIANAPTDLTRLLAAIEAVEALADTAERGGAETSMVTTDMIRTALAAALGSDTTNQEGTP